MGRNVKEKLRKRRKEGSARIEEEKKLERARDPSKNLPFTGPLILI